MLKCWESVVEVASMLEKMQGSASGLNQATSELKISQTPLLRLQPAQQVSDRLQQTLGLSSQPHQPTLKPIQRCSSPTLHYSGAQSRI